MERETIDIKSAVYIGMSIFNTLKNSIVKIEDYVLTLEDKKYLSLYLGLIRIEEKDEELLNMFLKTEEYLELYKNYFNNILDKIDFSSMNNYVDFLFSKEIIKKIQNKKRGSNKKLVKK